MSKLEQQPSERMKTVFLSIIVSLVVNCIVFGGLAIAFSDQIEVEQAKVLNVELLSEDVVIPSPQEIADNYLEVKSVTANRRARYSNTVSSFSSRSESRMQEQIDADLANLEQQVIEELREKGIGPEEVERVEKRTFDENTYAPKPGDETSYAAAVVTYDIEDRTDRNLPVPAYKCKSAGKVVIDVEVNALGEVKSATVNLAQSTSNECLVGEALKSAQQSLFNSSSSKGKKQRGTITYQFLRQ